MKPTMSHYDIMRNMPLLQKLTEHYEGEPIDYDEMIRRYKANHAQVKENRLVVFRSN